MNDSKLDCYWFQLFDGDFRQTATIYVNSAVSKLFAIQRIYFVVDEENNCIRVSIIIDSVLKEFAVVPFSSHILSIEPFGEEGTPYTVFILSDDGIYEMNLKYTTNSYNKFIIYVYRHLYVFWIYRKTPLETCMEIMLSETGANVIDAMCSGDYIVIKTNFFRW